MDFQDPSWNICLSSLLLLASQILRYHVQKQTNDGENPTPATHVGVGYDVCIYIQPYDHNLRDATSQ